jgi:hypothetical protein
MFRKNVLCFVVSVEDLLLMKIAFLTAGTTKRELKNSKIHAASFYRTTPSAL